MSASAYTNKMSLITRLKNKGFTTKAAKKVAPKMMESGRPMANYVKDSGKLKESKKVKSKKPKRKTKASKGMTTGIRFVF